MSDQTLTFQPLSVCSYAEVRAERRRELGIEESLPETAADKVSFLCVLKSTCFLPNKR